MGDMQVGREVERRILRGMYGGGEDGSVTPYNIRQKTNEDEVEEKKKEKKKAKNKR